jgi:hypothetical protein
MCHCALPPWVLQEQWQAWALAHDVRAGRHGDTIAGGPHLRLLQLLQHAHGRWLRQALHCRLLVLRTRRALRLRLPPLAVVLPGGAGRISWWRGGARACVHWLRCSCCGHWLRCCCICCCCWRRWWRWCCWSLCWHLQLVVIMLHLQLLLLLAGIWRAGWAGLQRISSVGALPLLHRVTARATWLLRGVRGDLLLPTGVPCTSCRHVLVC